MHVVYATGDRDLQCQGSPLVLVGPGFCAPLASRDKDRVTGELDRPVYVCVCRARSEPLCPFHCAKRHLERLRLAGVEASTTNFLFPRPDRQPLKKFQVVQLIERVLQATRADEAGRQVPRFGGHTLRISGTQYLAALNVPLAQMQLQWRSIDRYVQLAPLLRFDELDDWQASSGKQRLQRCSSHSPTRARSSSDRLRYGPRAPQWHAQPGGEAGRMALAISALSCSKVTPAACSGTALAASSMAKGCPSSRRAGGVSDSSSLMLCARCWKRSCGCSCSDVLRHEQQLFGVIEFLRFGHRFCT